MPKTMEKQIELKVSYQAFLKVVEELSLEEKVELWKTLDRELAEIEDKLILKNPRILKQIQTARAEVEKGHYVGAKELLKLKGK